MSVSLFSDTFAKSNEKRLKDIRLVGSVNGCYTLASRKGQTEAGKVEVFACRIQSISPQSAVLLAPLVGEIGETVSTKFEQFDIIDGRISRVFNGGFAMDIIANDEERGRIAKKIDWIKKNRFQAFKDKRSQKRIQPPNPQSAVTLPDGSVTKCFVINVSRTGVAVSADISPEVGTRIAVGHAVGSVIRHLDVGFAVKFDENMELDDVDRVFAWSLKYADDQQTDEHTQTASETGAGQAAAE